MSSRNVMAFKTVQGLDIIGDLVERDNENSQYIIKGALAIMIQNTGQGVTYSLGTIVYPPHKSSRHGEIDVNLNVSAIMFTYEPHPDLVKAYEEAVSGIEIASSIR